MATLPIKQPVVTSGTRFCALFSIVLCIVTLGLTGCGKQPATAAATAEESYTPASSPAAGRDATTNAQTVSHTTVSGESENSASTTEERQQRQLIGTWEQKNAGKRVLTVNEDGTASITAVLNDYRQYIVGKNLRFNIDWSLADGKLTFVTTGGEPAEAIDYITSLFGKTRVYIIRELDSDRLRVEKEEDGKVEPDWIRVPPTQSGT